MDRETQAAALIVTAEILALHRAGGRCSDVERHVERPSGRFLHLEATVQCSRMRLPVDTAILRGCPESTHWLLLGQQLQHLRAQFAARA
jgi:hypothetical protein